MKRRRGMLLMEMIGYLSLMAVLALLVAEITITGLRLLDESRRRDTLFNRVDTALDRLRRDAWEARSMEAIGNQVAIVQADRAVIWRMEPGGTLSRLDPASPTLKTTWVQMPEFSFEAKSALLNVQVETKGIHEQTPMVSQWLLAGGAP